MLQPIFLELSSVQNATIDLEMGIQWELQVYSRSDQMQHTKGRHDEILIMHFKLLI